MLKINKYPTIIIIIHFWGYKMGKVNSIILILFVSVVSNITYAQSIDEKPWSVSFYLNPSLIISNSDWSLSHPIYYGSGAVQYEEITGTFEHSFAIDGGLEVSKGHWGFQGGFGFIPQKLIKSSPAKNQKLNLVFGEISILYYPLTSDNESIMPYLSIGGGLLKTNGDIDNSGIVFSYAAGAKLLLLNNFGINIGLKGMLLKYTQLGLTESITKDISINPFKIFIGVFYKI